MSTTACQVSCSSKVHAVAVLSRACACHTFNAQASTPPPSHTSPTAPDLLVAPTDNWKLCLDSTCPYTPSPPTSPLDACDTGLRAQNRGEQVDPRQAAYCEYKVRSQAADDAAGRLGIVGLIANHPTWPPAFSTCLHA